MHRTTVLVLLIVSLVSLSAVYADQPGWAFQGVLTSVLELRGMVPAHYFSKEGTVLPEEQVAACFDIRSGDPLVLIRDGAVLAEGTIGDFVARWDERAEHNRLLYVTVDSLPEDVTVPEVPVGAEQFDDAGFDLYVFTDAPVEILAPDPLFMDIAWGVEDYVVRVGRIRFAIIREKNLWGEGFRGWQVNKITEERSSRVMADYVWWER